MKTNQSFGREKTVRSTSSSSRSIVWSTQQSDTFGHTYMHSRTAGRCLSTIEAHFPCFKLSACKRSPFRFLPLRHCLKIEFQYAFDVYVSKCFYIQHLKRSEKKQSVDLKFPLQKENKKQQSRLAVRAHCSRFNDGSNRVPHATERATKVWKRLSKREYEQANCTMQCHTFWMEDRLPCIRRVPTNRPRVDTEPESQRAREWKRVAARVCWCMSRNAMLQAQLHAVQFRRVYVLSEREGIRSSLCRLHSCALFDLGVIVVVHDTTHERTALYRTATAILTLVLFQVFAIHVVCIP